MTPKQLKKFRAWLGVPQERLADLLGYSRRQYQKMEKGEADIRTSVGLACSALAHGLKAYDEKQVLASPPPALEKYETNDETRLKRSCGL